MQTVLVTGAAGGIATRLRKLLEGAYKHIRWSDLRVPADLTGNETFMPADLADLAQVEKVVAGVDGIVHLGGVSDRAALGRHPQRQHRRLLQSVRGRAPRQGRARRLCFIEPRGRILSAAAPHWRRRAGASRLRDTA